MPVQRLSIQDFLSRSRGKLRLDVRSPGEYGHAHVPGATNLPLFTDEERKEVGTAYKQQSREAAIRIGLDFFGPKMRGMVEKAEALLNQEDSKDPAREIFIYCWRGGMRSAAVAWLMDLYGFRVFTLAGGYKTFRNQVLRSFEQPFELRIVGGFTGSGKTEVLQELEKIGEPVVDLEAIACHKGSAFGSFKMPKAPTQEMFENRLAQRLWNIAHETGSAKTHIWLEDESQRIGDVNIPNAFWENMRRSPVYFLEVPFEERLAHLTEEYQQIPREGLMDATRRIAKRLGPLETKTTLEHLENGNFSEAFRILLQYYDKRYLKGLHNREQLSTLLTRIQCQSVATENAQLLTKYQPA